MNDIQHAGSGNTANRLRRFPWYSTVGHASARQARAAVFLPSLSATHKGISISESHSVVSDSLRPHRLHSPWSSPGQIIGVGSPSLLQGIFPTRESNPGLPQYGWSFYQLSHKGSPRIPEWVAYPPSPGNLPDPRIKLGSPALQVDSVHRLQGNSPWHLEHLTLGKTMLSFCLWIQSM